EIVQTVLRELEGNGPYASESLAREMRLVHDAKRAPGGPEAEAARRSFAIANPLALRPCLHVLLRHRLLREPGGFEGLLTVPEDLNTPDLAVAEVVDVGELA